MVTQTRRVLVMAVLFFWTGGACRRPTSIILRQLALALSTTLAARIEELEGLLTGQSGARKGQKKETGVAEVVWRRRQGDCCRYNTDVVTSTQDRLGNRKDGRRGRRQDLASLLRLGSGVAQPFTLEYLTMADQPKEPVQPPKKKIVRCDQICTYVGSGRDAPRCKNKCAKEPGHFLNCKCRTHEMQ